MKMTTVKQILSVVFAVSLVGATTLAVLAMADVCAEIVTRVFLGGR